MDSTAKALVVAMSYLELWGDDVVDPDVALVALESISAELQGATKEEIEAISKAAKALSIRAKSEDEKEFYEDFMDSFLPEE